MIFTPHTIPADIVFILKILPHEVYKRVNDDLVITKEITLKQAQTGFSLPVILPNGVCETVNVKKLKYSDQSHVQNNLGFVIRQHSGGNISENRNRGSLIINFRIKLDP